MTEPTPDDALNLEALSLDELERELQPGSDAVEPLPTLQGPQTVRRCDSVHRELLQNHFPPADQ